MPPDCTIVPGTDFARATGSVRFADAMALVMEDGSRLLQKLDKLYLELISAAVAIGEIEERQ